MSAAPSISSLSTRTALILALLGAVTWFASGCSLIHGEGQVGSNLKPRGEAGISIPFGK
jgi:hypothetical protein